MSVVLVLSFNLCLYGILKPWTGSVALLWIFSMHSTSFWGMESIFAVAHHIQDELEHKYNIDRILKLSIPMREKGRHGTDGRKGCNVLNIWEFVYFVFGLSPPKRCVIRRQNLARRRVPTMCRTCARFYVYRGRHYENNDIFPQMRAYFCSRDLRSDEHRQ